VHRVGVVRVALIELTWFVVVEPRGLEPRRCDRGTTRLGDLAELLLLPVASRCLTLPYGRRWSRSKGRRAHGEGSVYEQRPGVWAAVVDLGWIDGKRKRKYVYARSEAEAIQKRTSCVGSSSSAWT
jgi:hypothetical protein